MKICKGVYTTGEAAAICKVAPRTVSKWFDRGRFEGGYVLPDSRDRRIPVEALRRFLRENGMPEDALPPEKAAALTVCLPCGDVERLRQLTQHRILQADSEFEAGTMAATADVLVIDLCLGVAVGLAMAKQFGPERAIVILPDGESEPAGLRDWLPNVLQRPFSLPALVAMLDSVLEAKE